jgi:hypothetical protein
MEISTTIAKGWVMVLCVLHYSRLMVNCVFFVQPRLVVKLALNSLPIDATLKLWPRGGNKFEPVPGPGSPVCMAFNHGDSILLDVDQQHQVNLSPM